MNDRATAAGKAMALYSGARFGLFLLCFGVFYLAGMGLLLALAVAAVLSGVVGYFLLAKQRIALSTAIDGKVQLARSRAAQRTAQEDAIADDIISQQGDRPDR